VAAFCLCALTACSLGQAASGISTLNKGTERYLVVAEM
jgi:hypothetical protein